MKRTIAYLLPSVLAVGSALADDWPEWRGKGRLGVWNESGILERFPEEGLIVTWRTPVRAGFAGAAVAAGRVFVTDFARSPGMKGTERVLCLDERTGKILWAREWDANYIGIQDTYATGPRATPTVDGDRVYIVGGSGNLLCLSVRTGEVLWQKDYVKDYGMQMPTWGITSAPLVDGDRLIAIVGGQPNAKVMAFDKMTGKEIWRRSSVGFRAGLLPACDHRGWGPTAVDHLASDGGGIPQSGYRQGLLAAAIQNQHGHDAGYARTERPTLTGFILL